MAEPTPSPSPSLGARLPQGMLAAFLKYVEARGLLASLEAQDALQQLLRALIFGALAAITAFTGWLLFAGWLAGLLVSQLEWSWLKSIGVLAGAHLLFAFIFLLATWRTISASRWFADTLNEFKKDRAWLANQTEQR